MYQNPFGSIFGEGPLEKTIQPAPIELEIPASEEDRNKLLESKKAVQNEELRPPKELFSRETPQFRAASTVVSTDPQVLLSQSDLSLEKSQIKFATLTREAAELKDKIAAAEVYLAVLNEMQGLPNVKQKEIQTFILQNEEKLKKIINSERIISASKDIKEATAALNTEIKHWEALDAQKGKVELTSFRPTKRVVTDEPPIKKLLPKIGGNAANTAKLDKNGVAIYTGITTGDRTGKSIDDAGRLTSLGDAPIETDEVISAKPKKEEYYIKYKAKLPDQSYFVKKRNELFRGGALEKKTERNVLLAQQYEWKSTQLARDITALTEEFNKLQAMVAAKAAQLPNQKILTGLSVAITAKPDQFRSGMILDNLRAVIATKTLSGLGDGLPPSEVVTATADKEIQTREKVLTDLQTKVITQPADAPNLALVKHKSWLSLLLGILVIWLLLGRK